MRLRRKPSTSASAEPAALPAGSRWAPEGGVPLGIRGGSSVISVDERGALHSGAGWSLRWWIGTEDGWHDPAERVGTRQSLREGTPVIDTVLRVPGGDARATAWAAKTNHGSSAVLEVRNEGRSPFGLALVLGPAAELEVHGCLVTSGDLPIVALERPPSDVLAATSIEELWEELSSNGTSTMPRGAHDGYLALVYPIAHTTGLRISLALDGLVCAPADVPDADAVSRGWRRQLGEVTRLVLPDAELERLVTTQRCYLLTDAHPVAASVDAAAALQLARFDHVAEARRRLDAVLLGGSPRELVATAAAYARLDPEVSPALVEPAITALAQLGRRRTVAAQGHLAAVASIFDAAGRFEEAESLRKGVGTASASRGVAAGSDPSSLDGDLVDPAVAALWQDLSGSANGVGTWRNLAGYDPARAAELLGAVVAALVDDADPSHLDFLPGWIEPWRGQGLEVHGLATTAGRLSLALRWHGARAAFLWEIEPNVAHSTTVPTVRCRSLDPAWRGRGWRGEALLGEPSEPSLPVDPDDSFS